MKNRNRRKKNAIKGNQVEEHHRRSRSLDGTSKKFNISLVPSNDHMNYHVIAGNMNAMQFSEKINGFHLAPIGKLVKCRFINNGTRVEKSGREDSKDISKVNLAWKSLFPDPKMSFEEKIAILNNIWIDPSYQFYIVDV